MMTGIFLDRDSHSGAIETVECDDMAGTWAIRHVEDVTLGGSRVPTDEIYLPDSAFQGKRAALLIPRPANGD